MPNITVRDLIRSAYVTSGDVALGEPVSGAEEVRALAKFNDIVSVLSLENLWAYTLTKATGPLTAGQDIYTIGNEIGDEDFLTPRPPEIVSLSLKIANVWRPLRQLSETEYYNSSRLETGTANSIPTTYTYTNGSPTGQIIFYPTPAEAYEVFLTTRDMKTEYTENDELTLPAGYQGYLEYALASVLAVDGGVVDVQSLVAIAAQRKGLIKKQNYQPRLLRTERVTDYYRGYNIHTDQIGVI